jgi:creatinine amidohydrolase
MSNKELKFGVQTDMSIFADTMVEMTWVKVKESAENGDIVLFPIGVIEEHGPHMDLSPDVYCAYLACKFLKQKLQQKGINSVIAPPYYWGISNDVKKYPGTFSVRPETFKAMLIDIFTSLNSWGFKYAFILNAHGDLTHVDTIEQSIKIINENTDMHVYYMGNLDIEVENPPAFPAPREGKYEPDYHAGAIETAVMFTYYPQKVNEKLAKNLKPQDTFDPLGYCGDPASFPLENTIIEFWEADSEMDALKIEAVLKRVNLKNK